MFTMIGFILGVIGFAGIGAVVQEDRDKVGIGISQLETTNNTYRYFDFFGGLKLYVGKGSPNAIITGNAGDIYIDRTTTAPNLYLCTTDASTTWTKVASL